MSKKDGFTLLELSIVLTIIGLLVSGIILGQNLLHTAQVRSVTEDMGKYSSALMAFKDKYNAIPGDMKNATLFWGAVAGAVGVGQDATCIAYFDATHTKGIPTCNGNGNGQIPSTGNDWHEAWRAWQHLADAGMVEGMYTGQGLGAPGTAQGNDSKLDFSSPSSKIRNLTYLYLTQGAANASHVFKFPGEYGLTLMIGAYTEIDATVMNAADASSIDSKLDDNKPGKGLIRAYKNSVRPHCSSTDDPDTAEYTISDPDLGCNLYYILQNN